MNKKQSTSNVGDVDDLPPPPYSETDTAFASTSQPRYQTVEIPMPVQTRQQRQNHRQFPMAAIFFLFGWFCPPLWILGACCCAGSRNDYEAWWGKVNFVMAVVLIVSSLFYSILTMSQY